MAGVDVARLHGHEILDKLIRRLHRLLEEGNDDLVNLFLERGIAAVQRLAEKLGQDANQLVIDQGCALEARLFQPLDLLLDDELERGRADKEGRRRARRVVEDGADIHVLDLVKGIHRLDAVGIQLVEDEADSGTTRQLRARKLRVVAIQHRAPLVSELGDDVEHNVGAVAEQGRAQRLELLRILLQRARDAGLDVGQGLLDVHHQDEVELSGQIGRAAVGALVPIGLVVLEKVLFGLEGRVDGLLVVNVPLSAVDDRDIAETERDDAPSQDVDHIGALVHQIHLGEDADGALALGVHLSGQLQAVRVGEIDVGGGDGQDDGVGLLDVLEDHVSDLALDIAGLVANGHAGQAGKIDEGEVEDVWGVDAQVDGGRGDACVPANLGLGLPADLIPNLVEVKELLAWDVEELAPLARVGCSVGGALDFRVDAIGPRVGRAVDELEDERPTGDDAGTAGQATDGGGWVSPATAKGGRNREKGGGHLQVATDNVF